MSILEILKSHVTRVHEKGHLALVEFSGPGACFSLKIMGKNVFLREFSWFKKYNHNREIVSLYKAWQ